jgi:hypothetical protein
MLAQVDYNKNYVYIKYPESVDAKTLYGVLKDLEKIDSFLKQTSHRLHDFRLTDNFTIDPELLETMIKQELKDKNLEGVKTALVIINKLQFELARIFDCLMENSGMRIAIFSSLDQAIEYLTT